MQSGLDEQVKLCSIALSAWTKQPLTIGIVSFQFVLFVIKSWLTGHKKCKLLHILRYQPWNSIHKVLVLWVLLDQASWMSDSLGAPKPSVITASCQLAVNELWINRYVTRKEPSATTLSHAHQLHVE